MYITVEVGPIHDKFNKACKTTTAIPSITAVPLQQLIRPKKTQPTTTTIKTKSSLTLCWISTRYLIPPFRDLSPPDRLPKSHQLPGRTNLVVS